MSKLRKLKKSNGEIVNITEVRRARDMTCENFEHSTRLIQYHPPPFLLILFFTQL